jgi:hypothetical protein
MIQKEKDKRESVVPQTGKDEQAGSAGGRRHSRRAKRRTLSVNVIDIWREPVEGIVLSNQGDGSQSDPTDNSGSTHVSLPIGTQPNDPVFLQLVRGVEANEKWEIMTGDRASVPPFDNKAHRFITVMLISRFDKQFLANRNYLNSLSVNRLQSKSLNRAGTEEQKVAVTGQELKEYKLDEAVQAARLLQSQENELVRQKLEILKKTVSLAQSYFGESRFHESVAAYREALALHPNDPKILSEFATALANDNNYAEAAVYYELFLTIQDQTPEVDQPDIIMVLEGYLIVLRKLKRDVKVSEVENRISVIRNRANWRGQSK